MPGIRLGSYAPSACDISVYHCSSVPGFFRVFNLDFADIHHHHFSLPPWLIQLPLAGQVKLATLEQNVFHLLNDAPDCSFMQLEVRVGLDEDAFDRAGQIAIAVVNRN